MNTALICLVITALNGEQTERKDYYTLSVKDADYIYSLSTDIELEVATEKLCIKYGTPKIKENQDLVVTVEPGEI